MNESPDAFTEVLGAYALDAVDPDERVEIERHLAQCPRCRAEVVAHREVAALLSQAGAPAPDGVWDRIVAELTPPAPALRMSFSRDGEVDPLADPLHGPDRDSGAIVDLGDHSRRRFVRVRTFASALAVAAAIIAVLGVVAVSQTRQAGRTQTASIDRLAADALGQAKLQVHLKGRGAARAVVKDSGQGFLIRDDLSGPAEGNVYQLWGQVDGTILSLGTFGGDEQSVPFQLDPSRIGDVQSFKVTQERAPGAVRPTPHRLVMAGIV